MTFFVITSDSVGIQNVGVTAVGIKKKFFLAVNVNIMYYSI
jgi:hypothetical protein